MSLRTKPQLLAQKIISVCNPDYPTPEMVEFVGKIASENIREKYVGKQMPELHGQNPIRYYNC